MQKLQGRLQKKKVTDVTFGGGSGRQNVTFLQVVFKIHFTFQVILSHFGKKNLGEKWGGTPLAKNGSKVRNHVTFLNPYKSGLEWTLEAS